MTLDVAPGVFALDHQVVEGKNAVVFGARGALAIDCGTDPEEGKASLALIRSRRVESVWLAMTHCHGDHALGSGCFKDAADEVIAHDAFPANLRRHLARRAGRAEGTAPVEECEERLAWPTLTFSDELRLDLGGKTLRFVHTPGHSADSMCVFLEEGGVLFGGDTVVTCIPPAFGDGDSREMERSLERLKGLGAKTLVPGHGPVIRGASEIRAHLEWLVGYLAGSRGVVERTRREDREAWIEAALAATPLGQLYGPHIEMERHRNDGRHRATITKLVDEEVRSSR
jgi:glyoxylase-like metal-dependent hydrolase (beta-lactamase superfamily II)